MNGAMKVFGGLILATIVVAGGCTLDRNGLLFGPGCDECSDGGPDGSPDASCPPECDGGGGTGGMAGSGGTPDGGGGTGGTPDGGGGTGGEGGTPCVPETEVCDGVDNDCDNVIDNGFGIGDPCEGEGECGPGTVECADESTTRCSTDPGGSQDESVAELCDGVDNDCDGAADEEFPTLGSNCDGVGECGAGTIECFTPSTTGCSTDPGGSADQSKNEVCNTKDDDCNGVSDQGNVCTLWNVDYSADNVGCYKVLTVNQQDVVSVGGSSSNDGNCAGNVISMQVAGGYRQYVWEGENSDNVFTFTTNGQVLSIKAKCSTQVATPSHQFMLNDLLAGGFSAANVQVQVNGNTRTVTHNVSCNVNERHAFEIVYTP